MVSPIPGSLSKSNEETVRKIFKTICATKFEDPVDQDSFLVDSANTVLQLQFRPQIASFALVPELGECIFTIRSMMHANNARLGTLFSDAFISIQDFAGEIVRKRQMFRERRRAHIDRMRAAGGTAARIERNAALEYAANTDHKSPHSPGEDVVSIPSSGDESGADEPVPIPKNPPSSPITVDLINIPPSSQVCPATLLSPIDELGFHLSRMSLNAYPNLLAPRKRRRVEEGENGHSQAAQLFYARPSRPMQHSPNDSAPLRPAASPSEAQLRGRLAAIQAEIRRLASAQKELYWQLQTLRQSEPCKAAVLSQVGCYAYLFPAVV
ncbi:hypothetical protein K438DRAFT_1935613 [Mycena galopus ATCC 62051]|nr:hypothetical protein K438DRAFT_1935613 [Mycena galopus ATCC 62051]